MVSLEAEYCSDNVSQGGHDWIEVFPSGCSDAVAMEVIPTDGTRWNTGYLIHSPRIFIENNDVVQKMLKYQPALRVNTVHPPWRVIHGEPHRDYLDYHTLPFVTRDKL